MATRRRSEWKDRAYAECDDACAICGTRGTGNLTVHHIDHQSKNTVYDNLLLLCRHCHREHNDGREPSDEAIKLRKRHLIEKTLTQVGVSALKIATRKQAGVVGAPYLLFHLVHLGYLQERETVMNYEIDGEKTETLTRFTVTDYGRALIARWFSD